MLSPTSPSVLLDACLMLISVDDTHWKGLQDEPNDSKTHVARQILARQLSDATAHTTLSVTFPGSVGSLSIEEVGF